MENEELATKAILEKMRDNPNVHLHQMQQEVDLLSKKIDPILKRVEQAQATIKGCGSRLSDLPGPLGMLSKMGGRLIAFYADDLATLLLDDFLTEVITDLQKIESKQSFLMSTEETQKLVDNILGVISDYQQEENEVETKYCNKV